MQQECIPVGCVPRALCHAEVGGGGSSLTGTSPVDRMTDVSKKITLPMHGGRRMGACMAGGGGMHGGGGCHVSQGRVFQGGMRGRVGADTMRYSQ